MQKNAVKTFLLTHPSRDVTIIDHLVSYIPEISTHTSLAGCDVSLNESQVYSEISTHTSLAGCDFPGARIIEIYGDFYSHIPRGM